MWYYASSSSVVTFSFLFVSSPLQFDRCSHFFQMKNISFCGCHPRNNWWTSKQIFCPPVTSARYDIWPVASHCFLLSAATLASSLSIQCWTDLLATCLYPRNPCGLLLSVSGTSKSWCHLLKMRSSVMLRTLLLFHYIVILYILCHMVNHFQLNSAKLWSIFITWWWWSKQIKWQLLYSAPIYRPLFRSG